MLAVPVMSFVMNPIQAAGILLPLLVLMDVMAMYIYWKKWRVEIFKLIIPASIIGIIIGSLTFQYNSENQIRLVVGIISILFVIISLIQKNNLALKPTKIKGIFWSGTAGYTSFLIHPGAPPMNFYILPLKLDKTIYIGTTTFAYFIINSVKLIPYYFLDLLVQLQWVSQIVFLPFLLPCRLLASIYSQI